MHWPFKDRHFALLSHQLRTGRPCRGPCRRGLIDGSPAVSTRSGPTTRGQSRRHVGRLLRRTGDLAAPDRVPAGDGRAAVSWACSGCRCRRSRPALRLSAVVLGLMVALAARPPLWVAAADRARLRGLPRLCPRRRAACRRRPGRVLGWLRASPPASCICSASPSACSCAGPREGSRCGRPEPPSPWPGSCS